MTFRIFAAICKNTLGDFCHDALVASAVASQFDDAELTVYYRNNRPYKRDILDCIPGITKRLEADENLPIDAFGSDSGASEVMPWGSPNDHIRKSNLIFAGDMFVMAVHSDIPKPYLRIPEAWEGRKQLTEFGLDPEKWFAVVYWKESGYEFRKVNKYRDVTNPVPYVAVMNHVLASGGQVVRIGHPGTTINPVAGYFDLTWADNHRLQMIAVAHARFMLASASGPSSYGPAFGTPTVVTDAIEFDGVWRDRDYLVLRHLLSREPIKWEQNTQAELCAAADEMMASTKAGWREPSEHTRIEPPNRVVLPFQITEPKHLLTAPSKRAA